MSEDWKNNPCVVNIEEKKLLEAVRNLYSQSMMQFFGKSKYDSFIDSETFEKYKAKIWELSSNRNKLEELIKNKFKETHNGQKN
jgi:hypothetical protein